VEIVKTILIVEDNEVSMKLFNALLQAHGYMTLQSVDGMDTMHLAEEHRPDLILMDIQLPVVSGIELAKMLKADDDLKDIPILAVSAFAMKGEEEKIFEAGFDGYIPKPISVPYFLEMVANFISDCP